MRLRVKSFGPIQQVDVDFRNLTILIGKNNLGKSYLAQLYYAIIDCTKQSIEPTLPSWAVELNVELADEDYLFYANLQSREQLRELAKKLTNNNEDNSIIIKDITDIFLKSLSDRIGKLIQSSLERSFGVAISKLVNINHNFSKIRWDINELLEVSVELTKKGKVTAVVTVDELRWKPYSETLAESKIFETLKTAPKRKNTQLAKLHREIWRLLISNETRKCWHGKPYYIPAGRGGLIESYETVVQGLVSLSPVAPVRGLSMPPMPGMAAQFYTIMLQLKNHKGPLNKIVSEPFKQMFKGEIQFRKVKGQLKSRLVYKFSSGNKTGETDLIHAASMIKELTPIYSIVKELVRRGDYLLIEEPESHLHPGAQIKMANVIGDIASNKVNVLITSHSDIMLRAVGHMLGEVYAKASPQIMGKATIYWLKEGETGCTSEEIKISKRGIIKDIPSFDDVIKELYETEIKLENDDFKGEQAFQKELPLPPKA
jgi:predicted ATPase